jgi:hypothetical protein
MGMMGFVFSIASVVGPLLGGALTQHVSVPSQNHICIIADAVLIGKLEMVLLHQPSNRRHCSPVIHFHLPLSTSSCPHEDDFEGIHLER